MAKYAPLKNLYDIDKTIGCGGFAKVKLATHLATGEKVAIKIMDKKLLKEDVIRVKYEIKALQTLSHPNMCQLYQVIETDTHYYLVMEYCSGGELFDHIVDKQKLEEAEARKFFRKIVGVVSYLHSCGFAHRDLKPENILLDQNQNAKLIDFGLCVAPDGGMKSHLETSCGSPSYAAPELVLGHKYYGANVDVWSMGVLLYALLCGTLPFDDSHNITALYNQILSGKYHEPKWLSLESRLLIKSLLQVDPNKRITTEQLRYHPWVIKDFGTPVGVSKNESCLRRDADCLAVLSRFLCKSPDEVWSELQTMKYDYNTATYLILLAKNNNNGLALTLKTPLRQRLMSPGYDSSSNEEVFENLNQTRVITRSRPKRTYMLITPEETTEQPRRRSERNARGDVVGEGQPRRKLKKVILENANQVPVTPEINLNSTYVVGKGKNNRTTHEAQEQKQSTLGVLTEQTDNKFTDSQQKKFQAQKRSHDVDVSNKAHPGPDRTPVQVNNWYSTTPRSARQLMSSSLNRMRLILTPRRTRNSPKPVTLTHRELCNVTSTSSTDPQRVLTELKQALHNKGIDCIQKGYTLCGKVKQSDADVEAPTNYKLSFQLEVCWIADPTTTTPRQRLFRNSEPLPPPNSVVGIRRKRLKGDAWIYKNICEEILALSAVDHSTGDGF